MKLMLLFQNIHLNLLSELKECGPDNTGDLLITGPAQYSGGHRALVMVDGLNWYDYGYYYNTGAIPMTDVERIEIGRGPFSALYGTLAQTAVINYITKIPESGNKGICFLW